MATLRAVRLQCANALGVFPLAHAVTDVYISLAGKNKMPLVSATSTCRTYDLTVQI